MDKDVELPQQKIDRQNDGFVCSFDAKGRDVLFVQRFFKRSKR